MTVVDEAKSVKQYNVNNVYFAIFFYGFNINFKIRLLNFTLTNSFSNKSDTIEIFYFSSSAQWISRTS